MAVELTWLGHGTWLIKTGPLTLLLDPFLNDNPAAPVKAGDVNPDVILVSHGHYDHVADLMSIVRRMQPLVISTYEICEWAKAQGAQRTHGMNIGGGYRFDFGYVKQTNAIHSSVLPDGSPAGSASGFVLKLPGATLYFACDTALFGDMQFIGAAGLDFAAVPIGDNFTMGPDDAVMATKLLQPKKVAPAHFNTWPPIAQDADAWAARIRAETTAEPIITTPGTPFVIG